MFSKWATGPMIPSRRIQILIGTPSIPIIRGKRYPKLCYTVKKSWPGIKIHGKENLKFDWFHIKTASHSGKWIARRSGWNCELPGQDFKGLLFVGPASVREGGFTKNCTYFVDQNNQKVQWIGKEAMENNTKCPELVAKCKGNWRFFRIFS